VSERERTELNRTELVRKEFNQVTRTYTQVGKELYIYYNSSRTWLKMQQLQQTLGWWWGPRGVKQLHVGRGGGHKVQEFGYNNVRSLMTTCTLSCCFYDT
jgi:hypothetical protein